MERDSELICKFQQGDNKAFETIVKNYQNRLYCVALNFLKDKADAEDALSETFMIAYKELKKFKHNSSLYTWLYRILVNICWHKLKDRKKAIIFSLDNVFYTHQNLSEDLNEISYSELLPSFESNPFEEISKEEIKAKIHSAISALKKKFRQIIILREFYGLNYEEIAIVIKCSKGTVMSRLSRARKLLAKLLEKTL